MARVKRRVGLGFAAAFVLATPVTIAPLDNAWAGAHGHVGAYRAGVVKCTYKDGRLQHLSVTPPRVEADKHFKSPYAGGGQYVRWRATLQELSTDTWKSVATEESGNLIVHASSFARAKPIQENGWFDLRGDVAYRIKERVIWVGLDAPRAAGHSTFVATHVHYANRVTGTRNYCANQAPTASAFPTATVAPGAPFSTTGSGLLATAQDADGNALHAELVDVKEAPTATPATKTTWTGADETSRSFQFTSSGTVSFNALTSDGNQTIEVSYVIIDDAGAKSAPLTLTVNVADNAPTAAAHSYSATSLQQLSVPAPGLLQGGHGTTAALAGNANFDTSAAQLVVDPDGSFSLTPTAANDAQTLHFDYTISSAVGTSEPATVTITVSHHAPAGAADGTYTVKQGQVVTYCHFGSVLTNDTFYGATTYKYHKAVVAVTSFGRADHAFVLRDDGCWTFTVAPQATVGSESWFTYYPEDSADNSTWTSGTAVQVTLKVAAA